MIKTRHLIVSLLMMAPAAVSAVPAYPWPQRVSQPDGTVITYRLQGDERASQMVSLDGYLLTRRTDGTICYADRLADGSLKAIMPAHDVRSPAETAFLSKRRSADALPERQLPVYERERAISHEGFRGLVILVNYTNSKLSVPNADVFYREMINSRNYTGYVSQENKKLKSPALSVIIFMTTAAGCSARNLMWSARWKSMCRRHFPCRCRMQRNS